MDDVRKVRRDSLVEALVVVLGNRAAHVRRLRTMNIVSPEEAEDMLAFIRRVKSSIDICNQAFDQTEGKENG